MCTTIIFINKLLPVNNIQLKKKNHKMFTFLNKFINTVYWTVYVEIPTTKKKKKSKVHAEFELKKYLRSRNSISLKICAQLNQQKLLDYKHGKLLRINKPILYY